MCIRDRVYKASTGLCLSIARHRSVKSGYACGCNISKNETGFACAIQTGKARVKWEGVYII